MHVLVAGGGVGGLCLAQGLRKAGIAVTVFERDATIATRDQGYRIHIDTDGNSALRHCLPPELFATYLATSNRPGPAVAIVLHFAPDQVSGSFALSQLPGIAVFIALIAFTRLRVRAIRPIVDERLRVSRAFQV